MCRSLSLHVHRGKKKRKNMSPLSQDLVQVLLLGRNKLVHVKCANLLWDMLQGHQSLGSVEPLLARVFQASEDGGGASTSQRFQNVRCLLRTLFLSIAKAVHCKINDRRSSPHSSKSVSRPLPFLPVSLPFFSLLFFSF